MSPFTNNRVCAPILWQITTSFIFVNDAKIVLILNLELEKITEISYNDAYDKVFFNTNEANLILRSGISPYFLKI